MAATRIVAVTRTLPRSRGCATTLLCPHLALYRPRISLPPHHLHCNAPRRYLATAPPSPALTPSPRPSPPSPSPSAASSDSVVDEALQEAKRLSDLTSPSSPPPASSTLIYSSPFLAAVKRVKLFSLTSCVLSLLSSPIYLLMAPATIPLSGRIALTTAVVSFSLGTTAALTRITHSYVTRIHLHPSDASSDASSDPVLTLETLNIVARPRYQRVRMSQLRPLYNRLMTNVRAVGAGEDGAARDFYLHVDLIDHPLLQPIAQQLIAQEAAQSGQLPQSEEEEASSKKA